MSEYDYRAENYVNASFLMILFYFCRTEPRLLAVKVQSPNHWTTRKVQEPWFLFLASTPSGCVAWDRLTILSLCPYLEPRSLGAVVPRTLWALEENAISFPQLLQTREGRFLGRIRLLPAPCCIQDLSSLARDGTLAPFLGSLES